VANPPSLDSQLKTPSAPLINENVDHKEALSDDGCPKCKKKSQPDPENPKSIMQSLMPKSKNKSGKLKPKKDKKDKKR